MVIAITIAIENLIRINHDLIFISESDPGSPAKIEPLRFSQEQKNQQKMPKTGCFDHKICLSPYHRTMIMHYTIITESHEKGGFTARCVEIPGAAGYGSTQGEALARIREAIEVVREAQNAELHKTIAAVHSEIIKIEVADSA
jgi:predicted RNase H-like HicB family nuclease